MLTKTRLLATIAQATNLTHAQVKGVLDALAQAAYANAADGFVIPDIGKLVVVDRPARAGRNPKTGETIQIPAKRALKFRIAKSAKDAILKG